MESLKKHTHVHTREREIKRKGNHKINFKTRTTRFIALKVQEM